MSQGKVDAADIIMPLNIIEFSPNSKKCEAYANWSHQTPRLSDNLLLEIKNSKKDWLNLPIPKQTIDQLIWMDELAGYSGVYYFESTLAKCLIKSSPLRPITTLWILPKYISLPLDEFFAATNPLKSKFFQQVHAWIKIALIAGLTDELAAKKSAQRVTNLTRVLLNSDQRFIHEAGTRSLDLIWDYLESPKAHDVAKYFPSLRELANVIVVSKTYTTILGQLSEKSKGSEIFNLPGVFPGKCAALSEEFSDMFWTLGPLPFKDFDQFKKFIDFNIDECPLTHLRSMVKSTYLANKKLKNWDASWRLLRSPWLTYTEFAAALVNKYYLIEMNRDRVNKLESMYK